MLVFNLKNKGTISQPFMANQTPIYKEKGLAGHPGIDHKHGFGMPISVDNDGYVYKVAYAKESPTHWQGVYMLCPNGDTFMEICMGHFSRVDVKVGDYVKQGQVIGLEGNYGDVYAQGIRITPEMQKAGDTRGSHVHESWRPIRGITGNTQSGKFYLQNVDGSVYRKNGVAYEIINRDEATRGHIDPMLYSKTETDVMSLQRKLISLLQQLYKLLKSK